jgi:DNA-binding response OmpR family regulator
MAFSNPVVTGIRGLVEVMYMFDAESKTRILVVEDEADILQVLCLFLQYSGFEVRGVRSGQEAIQLVREFCPQLIVLDLMMHPVSGWDVLHWLQAAQIVPSPPVLVMTALTHFKEQIRGYEEGAIEYMTKPTQPALLVERIRSILSLNAEQCLMLRHQHIDEKRRVLERLDALHLDEFTY